MRRKEVHLPRKVSYNSSLVFRAPLWSVDDFPEAAQAITSQGAAILSTSAWLRLDNAWRPWPAGSGKAWSFTTSPRQPDERWTDYCARTGDQSIEAVANHDGIDLKSLPTDGVLLFCPTYADRDSIDARMTPFPPSVLQTAVSFPGDSFGWRIADLPSAIATIAESGRAAIFGECWQFTKDGLSERITQRKDEKPSRWYRPSWVPERRRGKESWQAYCERCASDAIEAANRIHTEYASACPPECDLVFALDLMAECEEEESNWREAPDDPRHGSWHFRQLSVEAPPAPGYSTFLATYEREDRKIRWTFDHPLAHMMVDDVAKAAEPSLDESHGNIELHRESGLAQFLRNLYPTLWCTLLRLNPQHFRLIGENHEIGALTTRLPHWDEQPAESLPPSTLSSGHRIDWRDAEERVADKLAHFRALQVDPSKGEWRFTFVTGKRDRGYWFTIVFDRPIAYLAVIEDFTQYDQCKKIAERHGNIELQSDSSFLRFMRKQYPDAWQSGARPRHYCMYTWNLVVDVLTHREPYIVVHGDVEPQ